MQVNPDSTGLYLDSRQTQKPTQTLDKDAFMKILVNQLRYQNPLSPQDSDSFITQMVQLSTIEQITNLTAGMEKMLEAQEFSRAVSLIGYEVTVLDSNGETVDGTVEKVTMAGGQPHLVINNGEYDLSSLVYIREPVVETPEQPTVIEEVQASEQVTDTQDVESPEQITATQDEPGTGVQEDADTAGVIGG